VTRIGPLVLNHALASAGIDDDFFVLWPPIVLAALTIGDLDLAERLSPVTAGLPGQRPPAVAAQWHRLRGVLAAARGDDPQVVEAEMRAGVEEPARWLFLRHREDEAAPLHAAARATYANIGATSWLAKLDAWQTSLHGRPTASSTPLQDSMS